MSNQETNILTNNLTIRFYDDINPTSALDLIDAIKQAEELSLTQAIKLNLTLLLPPSIHLHINSGGGCVTSALAITDIILNCRVPIHTYVEGHACSAATLISIAGNRRFISKHSFMLIHQIEGIIWGTHKQIKDEAYNYKLIAKSIKEFYLNSTCLSKKKLKKLFNSDLKLTPKKCLEWGLVDEIIGKAHTKHR